MNHSTRRGFATIVALVSLMLIGVTTAGLMTCISMQARRTEAEVRRAQLEQIAFARTKGTVRLPTELQKPSN